MSALYHVTLRPFEPLLFTDNRSARAGEDHLIRDREPSPHTIYGAIGANIAKKLGASIGAAHWGQAAEYLGPFESSLANGSKERSELIANYYVDPEGNPWLAHPRHVPLYKSGNGLKIIEPARLSPAYIERPNPNDIEFASSLQPHFDAYLKSVSNDSDDDEVDQDVLVKLDALERILSYEESCFNQRLEVRKMEDLFRSEARLGLKMDNSKNCAEAHYLFSRPYRRFRAAIDLASGKWSTAAIRAEFKLMKPLPPKMLLKDRIAFLGGDRGRVAIDFEPGDAGMLFSNIKTAVSAKAAESSGFLAYLLTPAIREDDWPPCIENRKPVAAALGKHIAISGWNSAPGDQHPRPIRHLIPSGSVFLYRWNNENEQERRALIDRAWLSPISEKFRSPGFGRILIGVWK